MDEYTSEIFMGGKNTIVMHNTCEDSLLAAPIILDLVLLAELSTRIQFKAEGEVCVFCYLVSNNSLESFEFLMFFGSSMFSGEVSLFPPSSYHTQLPHKGTSCTTRDTCGERPI